MWKDYNIENITLDVKKEEWWDCVESKWVYRLQRKFGRFGIENLMIYVTATMLAVYALGAILMLSQNIRLYDWMFLSRDRLFAGELWRLVTFIFLPPNTSLLWMLISLYFYYFIGNSLENAWGSFSFTLYYLFGVIGAIIAALISGYGDNTYLNLSLFFAFAQLYPDHEILLFFILPVKIKYLAYLNWALFAISFLFGDWPTKAAILMSLLNFFIFFGPSIMQRIQDWRRYSAGRRQFRRNGGNPFGY